MRHTITLDVHKRETQACIANNKGEVLEEKRFRTTQTSYQRALKKYRPGDVIIESVGFYRPVAKWLTELGYDVHLAHLSKIPKPKLKTDKKDARHLLRLWMGDALPEAYLPPEETQRLRDLARHRIFLSDEQRRIKVKLKHELFKHGHLVDENPIDTVKGREWLETLDIPEVRSLLRVWQPIHEEVRIAQERIEACTTDHSVAQRLMTVPGIGAFTALVILGEVGDFRRFEKGDNVGAYAGLVPSMHQSGDTDRKGNITKEGNPVLRWALVEAARNHVRLCPESSVSKRHERLAKTKGYSKATIATARQLATVLHALVVQERDFELNP